MRKGRSTFCYRPLITHQQGQSGLSTVGVAHSLAVDGLGWIYYLFVHLLLCTIVLLNLTVYLLNTLFYIHVSPITFGCLRTYFMERKSYLPVFF